MSKRKHRHKHRFSPPANAPAALKQNGLKAFHRNDFSAAIDQWSRLDLEAEPAVSRALAEAHFRRALLARGAAQCQADLARSVELMPGEGRYWYHLGLAHHRADRLDEAIAAYEHAAETGFSRSGFGYVWGLAHVERDPRLSLGTLNGLSPADRTALLPIAALLRGDPQAVLGSQPGNRSDRLEAQAGGSANDPLATLWRGLAQIDTGQFTQALAALAPLGFPFGSAQGEAQGRPSDQPLKPGAEATRALYHGLALAATGDQAAAVAEWTAAAARTPAPRLQAAVANAHLRQSCAALEAGQWQTALALTQAALQMVPGQPSLMAVDLVAHNRLADEAAGRGEWAAAIKHWEHMRASLELNAQLGPIAPLLHNLAIAHERIEQWEAAAETWSALLGKLPRRPTKKSPAQLGLPLPIPELRNWLRRRVLDGYRRAGRPDQAISHYRNLIKASPDDLDARLELADALLANDQIIAGRNELQRILQKDPEHVDARARLAEVHKERGELYAAELHLRAALETDPQHAPTRRGMVEILCERGHSQFNVGYFAQARKIYEEALTFAPGDAQLLVWLGNTELALQHATAARERFDAALAASRGDLHTYVGVFRCWAQRGNLTEARHILDRAEAAGVASPHFYVDAAAECYRSANHPSSVDFLSSPRSRKAGGKAWERLGHELLDKAESASGDSVETLRHIVAILGPARASLALEYAQKLARRTPDDPIATMQLGVLQAVNGQHKAAKDSLRMAASLARRQGNREALQEIEHARQMINNPLIGLMSELGPLPEDFHDEDLFW